MITNAEIKIYLTRKLENAKRAGLRKEIKQLTEQLAKLEG